MTESPVREDVRQRNLESIELRIKAEQSTHATREARLDARRRLDALRRAQHTLMAHSEVQIRESLEALGGSCVIVHRNAWMREKLAVSLSSEGVRVVGESDNGADGLGISLAECPDLVLLEDLLPSMTGEEVARLLREMSPRTMVAAQVDGDASVATLLDAGAVAVFSRQVPVSDLVHQVVAQMRHHPET